MNARGLLANLLDGALGVLTQCRDVIEAQAYEIAMLRKQLFGRRSEKIPANQLALFPGLLEALVPRAPEVSAEPEPEPEPRSRARSRARSRSQAPKAAVVTQAPASGADSERRDPRARRAAPLPAVRASALHDRPRAHRGDRVHAAQDRRDRVPPREARLQALRGRARARPPAARRPFARVFELRDPLVPFFVTQFQALYRIEAQAKEQALTAPQRLELRQEHSRPILDRIRARAEELDPLPLGTPMREGVRYFQNQWERLLVPFERDGRLEIDNGPAERRLRRLTGGRRAWLFAGSPAGAHRIAQVLSLVASADAAAVDPGRYLADLFERIAGGWLHSRLDELMPHRWKLAQQRRE